MKNTVFTTKDANGEEIRLKVFPVTNEIRYNAQEVYQESFNKSLANKSIKLHMEMERDLEARGLMNTEADEKRRDELRKELRSTEVKLRKGIIDGRKMTKDEGRAIALKMKRLRAEILDIGSALLSHFSNTVEGIARHRQNQYLVFASVRCEDGTPYWRTLEEFEGDVSQARLDAVEKFTLAWHKADENFELKHYENAWLLKQGFINDKLQFVDSNGRLTDMDGRLINEKGQYIDENGHLVDLFGYPVDEDGNLLEPDTWVSTEIPQQAS